jgi:hypothetical protein
MAVRKGDQGSKEKIAKGMAEAGQGEVGKAGGGEAGKGEHGHGADPGKLSQGMAEAGQGEIGKASGEAGKGEVNNPGLPGSQEADGGTAGAEDASGSEAIKRGPVWRVLDYLEDILVRMIKGIIKFIFFQLPKNIIDLLLKLFPTFIKFIKVSFLLVVWLVIIIGPMVFFGYFDRFNDLPLIDSSNLVNLLMETMNFEISQRPYTILWLALAAVGSIWGIRYMRRRKGSLRAWRRNAQESVDQTKED